MISIGEDILLNPLGNTLERQQEYSSFLGNIDMIVFSPKTHNLKIKHYQNLTIYPSASYSMYTFIYDVLKVARKILKMKKIDIITTQDPFGTALAGYFLKKKYNIPLHIQNHSCFIDNNLWMNERPFLFRVFNKIAHFTLKRADRLRVVNSTEKQKYIAILGIEPIKIDIAPVPINIPFWQEEPSKEEKEQFLSQYNIDLSKPIISWAGRFVKFKNLPYLFKSISLVKKRQDINFLIAGNNKKSFWNLEELEDKYDIYPNYLGVLTHAELRCMYYFSDIYVHTSDYEGFGLVVSDAQASGTVVVSRKTAGTSEIIENGKSGYLVEGNEEEFASVVLDLLENNKLKKRLSLYAKKMMPDKFNQKIMFQNILSSIQKSLY